MTFEEALAFWFGRINFEVKSARPSDLKLERMRAFLAAIGSPQDRLRIVHVTGTKGKGSTVAMLASILEAAGYRVGQFTSPHLVEVNERMRVNGIPISRLELTALINELAPTIQRLETDGRSGPTYFEIGTALGFLHFLRRRVDLAVVEVGLGGRYDSTNVCKPLVSVITSVGFDHMAQLGSTLAAIAYQKAGIIKPRIPVICGACPDEAVEVIDQVARQMGSKILRLPKDFQADYRPPNQVVVSSSRGRYPAMSLAMPGEHQAMNAAVAVATVEQLHQLGLSIPDLAIRRGLESARCAARVEVIRSKPTVVLDAAHNVPSAKALVRTLQELFPNVERRVCVFAVSSDKQFPEILTILGAYFDEFILTRYSNNSRGVQPELLMNHIVKPGRVCRDPKEAFVAARSRVSEDGLICVAGSVFLAGELYEFVRM